LVGAASLLPPMSYDLAPVNNDSSLPFFQSTAEFDLPADFALPHVNLSTELPLATPTGGGKYAVAGHTDNYTYSLLDGSVPSQSAAVADDIDYSSTTLSTTLEHYSSASAALNHDHDDVASTHVDTTDARLFDPELLLSTASTANLSDTNALFQQLLRANLLLDELDLDNSTFFDHGKADNMLTHTHIRLTALFPGLPR